MKISLNFFQVLVALATMPICAHADQDSLTSAQSKKCFEAALNFASKYKISPRKIQISDEHYYDGSLSAVEIDVFYFRNKDEAYCTQRLYIEYPDPDHRGSKATIDTSELDPPTCK